MPGNPGRMPRLFYINAFAFARLYSWKNLTAETFVSQKISSSTSNMSSMSNSSDSGPLSAIGLDLTNETTAFDYLGEILDDTDLQVIDNRYATYFWYGIIVVIVIAVILNAFRQWKVITRYLSL